MTSAGFFDQKNADLSGFDQQNCTKHVLRLIFINLIKKKKFKKSCHVSFNDLDYS